MLIVLTLSTDILWITCVLVLACSVNVCVLSDDMLWIYSMLNCLFDCRIQDFSFVDLFKFFMYGWLALLINKLFLFCLLVKKFQLWINLYSLCKVVKCFNTSFFVSFKFWVSLQFRLVLYHFYNYIRSWVLYQFDFILNAIILFCSFSYEYDFIHQCSILIYLFWWISAFVLLFW